MKMLKRIILGLVLVCLLLVAASPVILYVFSWEKAHLKDDMFQEYHSHRFFADSITKFARFPLWSPSVGGGYPVYAHPHDPSMLLPLGLPVILFGEINGIRINVFILYSIGVAGMFFYARKVFSKDRDAVMLVVLLYATSQFFFERVASGNYNGIFIRISRPHFRKEKRAVTNNHCIQSVG